MTTAGKILTFLNLFVAVGLATWGLSVYSTGAEWVDRKTDTETVKGQITVFNEEITKLTKAVGDAQAGYGADALALAAEEADRDYRRTQINSRLDVARQDLDPRNGSFRVQLPQDPSRVYPPLNRPGNPALTDMTASGIGKPVYGPDGKTPLRGLRALQEDFAREVQEAQRLVTGQPIPPAQWDLVRQGTMTQPQFDDLTNRMGITDLRRLHGELSDVIARADAAVVKQKDILANLREESRYLADHRTSWDVQLQTLERRQRQLQTRLKQLGLSAGG